MALDSTKVFAQHLAKCKIVDTVVYNATQTTSGYVQLLDNLQTTYEGKRIAVMENYALAMRERESANISEMSSVLQATWLDYMEVIDKADNGSEVVRYQEAYNYMNANSIYFLSRGMTVTVATTSKGTLKTWSVDAYNYPIENSVPGTIAMTCESNLNLGEIPGREKWRIIPQNSGVDWIDFYNNPRIQQGIIYTWDSERNSLLTNPSFGSYADAGAGTTTTIGTANSDITDWTMVGTITNLIVQRDLYYANDAISGTAYSYGNALGVVSTMTTGTVGQVQTITNKLVTDRPYYAGVKFYRGGTAALGTLTLSVGTVSASVNMTDYSASTWISLEIPQNSTSWYKNFCQTTNGYVAFKWQYAPATNNAAVLYIDHCSFHPADLYGNQYMSMEQGTANFTYLDSCGYTVSYATTGLRQRCEAVLNNRYYPSATAATAALADI